MKAVYFAWVRERVGATDEEIAPPADVRTVGDLIGWLKHDAPIAGAKEIAFFPPMTGG